MKSHTVRIKQGNMHCHMCVMNIVKAISKLRGIEELNVDLETRSIKLKLSSSNVSRETIQKLVDKSIVNKGLSL